MNLVYHSDKIWEIESFFNQEECENFISKSETVGYEEAKVNFTSGAKMMKNVRNNSRLMYEDFSLAKQLWNLLEPFCPKLIEGKKALGLNEMFRFYKYEKGQKFKRHIEGRFKRSDEEESRITFMVYLNDDFLGGETKFDNITIKPRQGNALCFIHEQKHEGMPLISGVKYVLRSEVMYES